MVAGDSSSMTPALGHRRIHRTVAHQTTGQPWISVSEKPRKQRLTLPTELRIGDTAEACSVLPEHTSHTQLVLLRTDFLLPFGVSTLPFHTGPWPSRVLKCISA
ncbi:unnamed protein product [Caretta caretta]